MWCWYSYCQSHPPELERLIGCFIILWPCGQISPVILTSVSLSVSSRFALEGYAHQEVPFEKVVETVRPKRDLKSQPSLSDYVYLPERDTAPLAPES